MKLKRIIPIALLVIIISFFLPVVFKCSQQTILSGPDLSEIAYSEITFEHNTDSIRLAGMLMLPEGDGSFPIVVFIHGFGPSYRNSVWYVSVAEYLVNHGIAVVLPDKRGCEKSEGEWIGADFNLLASDVLSAVEHVKRQDIFRESHIGILGMSQGGWIAPLTARRINRMAQQKALVGFDPIPYWNQVSAPVFMAFGGDDKNVPVEKCIERLNAYKLNHFLVKIYPRGGHGISDPETKMVREDYLYDLVSFININKYDIY